MMMSLLVQPRRAAKEVARRIGIASSERTTPQQLQPTNDNSHFRLLAGRCNHCRWSSSSVPGGIQAEEQGVVEEEEATGRGVAGDSIAPPPVAAAAATWRRNPALADVIRDGLGQLNQASSYVQQSSHTRRPLFGKEDRDEWKKNSPRLLSEAERIFSVANDRLEEICRSDNDSSRSLRVGGEPLLLVHVDVRPSLQRATVYWSLPLSVLLDESISVDDKLRLQEMYREKVESRGTSHHAAFSKLQRQVHAQLARVQRKPPKIAWEPATAEMIYASIQELEV